AVTRPPPAEPVTSAAASSSWAATSCCCIFCACFISCCMFGGWPPGRTGSPRCCRVRNSTMLNQRIRPDRQNRRTRHGTLYAVTRSRHAAATAAGALVAVGVLVAGCAGASVPPEPVAQQAPTPTVTAAGSGEYETPPLDAETVPSST